MGMALRDGLQDDVRDCKILLKLMAYDWSVRGEQRWG